jgi:hypothetical protein
MSDIHPGSRAEVALRAIRSTLMKLENALNAGDRGLMRSLFGDSAQVVTRGKRISAFTGTRQNLRGLLWESGDSEFYCRLAVNEVALLSDVVAYSAVMLHLYLVRDDKPVLSTAQYLVVLGKDPPASDWSILLLHHLSGARATAGEKGDQR